MKILFSILLSLTLSLFAGSTAANIAAEYGGIDINPVATGAVVFFASVLIPMPKGSLLLTVNVTDVSNEMRKYFKTTPAKELIRQMVYQMNQLAKYTRPITSVKGRFPAAHSVLGRVVQRFVAEWNAVGQEKIKPNELKNYHQKVNFSIIPADVLNTWAAYLYQENKKPADMPISQYILNNDLKNRVVEDVDWLSMNGDYDSSDTFIQSMDGIIQVLRDGIADGTMYKVPLAAITESNVVDIFTEFEKNIPNKLKSKINKIYTSRRVAEWYKLDYINRFGTVVWNTEANTMRTHLGSREIVALDQLSEDILFATPDENFLRLIDAFDEPTVTDVQTQDYEVRVFMEWWLGYGFWINQMVVTSCNIGSGSGLAVDASTYYAN